MASERGAYLDSWIGAVHPWQEREGLSLSFCFCSRNTFALFAVGEVCDHGFIEAMRLSLHALTFRLLRSFLLHSLAN